MMAQIDDYFVVCLKHDRFTRSVPGFVVGKQRVDILFLYRFLDREHDIRMTSYERYLR
jgi:hypothetical protein